MTGRRRPPAAPFAAGTRFGPALGMLVATGLPAVTLAASFVIPACHDHRSPPAFDGARPFELKESKAGATPSQEEIERLVKAMIDVAGGAARLQHLSWRRIEDLYLSHPGNLLGNNVLCTTLVRPDESVLVRLEYTDGTEERRARLKGEEWLLARTMSARPNGQEPEKMRLATGGTQQYVEWDWEVARLPYLLTEAASLTPLPIRVEEGRTLVGVKVDVADVNPKFEAWIDVAGPMVVEVIAETPVTADLTTRGHAVQTQRFADFRRVKGVLFSFRRDLMVDERRFGLAEARSIETDVDLKDTEFVPQ
jgi:hypothetical protein